MQKIKKKKYLVVKEDWIQIYDKLVVCEPEFRHVKSRTQMDTKQEILM